MAQSESRKRKDAAQTPPPEPPRHYAPRGIAGLIAPMLRSTLKRRGTALAALIEDWDSVAGPDIAARTTPAKLHNGTLTIACPGPDALALSHMAPTLIARITLAIPNARIERLRFTAAPAPKRRTPQPRPPPRNPAPPPADLPDGDLGAALSRLHAALTRR